MAAAASSLDSAPHIPVLIRPILAAVAPVEGTWLDGTFGAGGYTRAFLEAGAARVIAVDRDPLAFEMAADWAQDFGTRLTQQLGVFSKMDEYAQDLDGVVLDLGVSSMQLDLAERGFSFMRDGPLDMRMSQDGPSAADLVNDLDEETLANIRIAVNDEYRELFQGLMAAERALKPGGKLAVVTFHSVEDRMVKRFLSARSGGGGNANRYAPEQQRAAPQFRVEKRKAITADAQELGENPRSRSAKLRVAIRTDAPSGAIESTSIAMPLVKGYH